MTLADYQSRVTAADYYNIGGHRPHMLGQQEQEGWRARPDSTPFRMPDDDPLPVPLDIGTDVRDQRLHLAVPLRRAGELVRFV